MDGRQNIISLQSKTIDFLRFPMVVMVVFIHCGVNLPEMIDWSSFDGIQLNYAIRIAGSHVFTHMAVPLFFLISGYLFFYGVNPNDNAIYIRKIKSRFYSLVAPYILWISIALFISFCSKVAGLLLNSNSWDSFIEWMHEYLSISAFWNIKEWNSDRVNWLGFPVPSSSPYLVPLWFIRDLIVMVILSPVIGRAIYWGGRFTISVFAFCYVSLIWPFFPGFDIESIFYYALGVWLAVNNRNLITESRKYMKICILLSILLGAILVYLNGHVSYWGNKIYPFFIFASSVSVFSIASYIVQNHSNNRHVTNIIRLKETVFFLFAIHSLVIQYVFGAISYILPDKWYYDILWYFIVPCILIIVCLGFFFFLKRFFPSMLKILTGGREFVYRRE